MMTKGIFTIVLLIFSNTFMTLAWYGHLKYKEVKWLSGLNLTGIILISWGIALFEYFLLIPANRIGFNENGGPFNIWQLKVIQEVITLTVFSIFAFFIFNEQPVRMNHLVGFFFLILAVYFIFKE
ncbi:MAG TPA: DMT family protein [Saprospiraceae bacterium]|nr:DMT family protein [Saprospiraceae bacterium]